MKSVKIVLPMVMFIAGCATVVIRDPLTKEEQKAKIDAYWVRAAECEYLKFFYEGREERGFDPSAYRNYFNPTNLGYETTLKDLLATYAGPRYALSDADYMKGRALLEGFAEKYMPNAFKRYEKMRERMGEVQQTFNDDFLPKLPETCGSKVLKAESELMFARGLKALVRARVEYERVHDELCHYYSLYRVEALSGAELTVIDQSELVVRPLGRNVLGYKYIAPQIKKHEGKIDEFAQKYMPESFAVYTSLKKEMDESQDLMNALAGELHLMDMTRVDRGSWALFGKIRHLCDELNDIVSVAEKFYSSYKLAEMSADAIAQEDHKLALSKQNYVKSVGGEIKERSFGSLVYRGDMVVVPGENVLLCKHRVTQFEWMMVFDMETCEDWRLGMKCRHYLRGGTMDRTWSVCPDGLNCSHGLNSVRYLSWDQCRAFMNELNEIGNYGLCVRFPTHDEWVACQDLGGHNDKKGARNERDSLGLYSICDGTVEWCDEWIGGEPYAGGSWASRSGLINHSSKYDSRDDTSLRLAASLVE